MKLFKRFATLALAGVMALGLLTGCAVTSTAYSELLVDTTMQQINSMRYWAAQENEIELSPKTLKNDACLRKELKKMLNQVDEYGYINGSDAYKYSVKLDGESVDVTYKAVFTYSDDYDDGYYSFADLQEQDKKYDNQELMVVDFANIYENGTGELYDLLATYYDLAPYMDSFAIEYRIVGDGVMYVAIGFTAEGAVGIS